MLANRISNRSQYHRNSTTLYGDRRSDSHRWHSNWHRFRHWWYSLTSFRQCLDSTFCRMCANFGNFYCTGRALNSNGRIGFWWVWFDIVAMRGMLLVWNNGKWYCGMVDMLLVLVNIGMEELRMAGKCLTRVRCATRKHSGKKFFRKQTFKEFVFCWLSWTRVWISNDLNRKTISKMKQSRIHIRPFSQYYIHTNDGPLWCI